METGKEGRIQFGPQPNTIPETHMAPESGEQPPLEGGGSSLPPVAHVYPGAPDDLMGALRSTSIMDEHRIHMGAVIEKVQSAKSGLDEACNNLLMGFEVSDIERGKPHVFNSP